MGLHAIKKQVELIRGLPLHSATFLVDDVHPLLNPLFKGYKLASPILSPGQVLYRGVKITERPSGIARITYPPADRVTTHQRANRPGRPMFYCSVAREAPFFELGCQPGEQVALSRWRLTQRIMVANAGYVHGVMQRLRSLRTSEEPWWVTSAPRPDSPINKLIHDFLAEEFTKIVPTGSEHLYKLSAAIAERFVVGQTIYGLDESFREKTFGGIIYPTIAMRTNSDNVALVPAFVDKYLKLEQVEYIRIDSASRDLKYQVTNLDFANSFGADGSIEWKGRLPRWEMPPGATWKFVVENGAYVAYDEKGAIVEPA